MAALRAGVWSGCSKHVCRCLGGDGNLGSVLRQGHTDLGGAQQVGA